MGGVVGFFCCFCLFGVFLRQIQANLLSVSFENIEHLLKVLDTLNAGEINSRNGTNLLM